MMLTIAKIGSPSDAGRYYAEDNYYTEGEGVEQSWWQGEGAEELGLNGQVDSERFKALLHGNIDENTKLGTGKNNNAKHRPGWDFTFSAPKSLSILSEVYEIDGFRSAHEKAVKDAIALSLIHI